MGIENDVARRRQELQKKEEAEKSKIDHHAFALSIAHSFHKDIYSCIVNELVKTNKQSVEGRMNYSTGADCSYSLYDFRYRNLFDIHTGVVKERVKGIFFTERWREKDVTIKPTNMTTWKIFFDEFDRLNRQENIYVTWSLRLAGCASSHLTYITPDFTGYTYTERTTERGSFTHPLNVFDFDIHYRYPR